MSERLTRSILAHVAHRRYRPQQVRALAESLGVEGDDFDAFARVVTKLVEAGEVVLGPANTLVLPPPGRQMVGSFRRNERGFGFIIPDAHKRPGHGDLFVPAGNTAGAMTGDRVRARVIHRPQRAGGDRSPYIGTIVEIIQRAERQYVGNLMRRGDTWLVQVDGNVLHEPVIIRDPGAKNAAVDDKVAIELIRYPAEDRLAEGVIVEVLGAKGEPDVETRAVMRAFGLPDEFPEAVLQQARTATSDFDDQSIPANRVDLTKTFICTIDPPDARDFDDAISITRLPGKQGGYELGIHIADAAHFITPASALDEQAKERANSTYLPGRVVPMLPELLSNGVCSLQEGIRRYCKSVWITYDAKGEVVSRRLARTVVCSAKRLTYLEAQALIDGDVDAARKHAVSSTVYPKPLIGALKNMHELARLIHKRRAAAGMIELALPGVTLIYDEAGNVVDAQPEDESYTHKIIEMLMVEANEAVATLFDSMSVPMIRRIHPDPAAHDINVLRQYARVAGYQIPARPNRMHLQQLLDSVRGTPAQQTIHFAVLRTLSQAEYAPLTIGHFALASDHYTHFTSPIRRYADLVVHRALDAYLDLFAEHRKRFLPAGAKLKRLARLIADDARCPDEQELVEIGRHCSAKERNSEAAERDLTEYLTLKLLAKHVGDDFAGTVTGVTARGIFVQIDRYLVDGMIRTTDLPGASGGGTERWSLNSATGQLVAQRSGRKIGIGDVFTVRLSNVHPEARRMDLVIVDKKPPGSGKKPNQPAATSKVKKKIKPKRLKKDKRPHPRPRPRS